MRNIKIMTELLQSMLVVILVTGCALRKNYVSNDIYKDEKKVHLYICPVKPGDITFHSKLITAAFKKEFKIKTDSIANTEMANLVNKNFKKCFVKYKSKFEKIDTLPLIVDSLKFLATSMLETGAGIKMKLQAAIPNREQLVQSGIEDRFILVTDSLNFQYLLTNCGAFSQCKYLAFTLKYAIWDYQNAEVVSIGTSFGIVSAGTYIARDDWATIVEYAGLLILKRSPFYDYRSREFQDGGSLH